MAVFDGMKDFFDGLVRGIGLFVCERNDFAATTANPATGLRSVR